jgi:ATP dependent DNA ligase domain
MLQRTLPAGFIAPCLPMKADKLPSGSGWLHEIKHDGFRVIARKMGAHVRLYSRPGNDLTSRFSLIVETLARLRSRSCIIDGRRLPVIELDGDDLRPDPLEGRKASALSIFASGCEKGEPGAVGAGDDPKA